MAENKKTKYQKLEEELSIKKENAWKKTIASDNVKINKFCNDYKKYLDNSKTEREAVNNTVALAKKAGFKDLTTTTSLKAGDKVYMINNHRSLALAIIGKTINQPRLIASHIDSPRLDLKPFPLYEDSELAMLKTHYYGGIKNYQWVNQPLALHGVVITKNGKKIELSIGENDTEPVFMIPDLLPHLAKKQLEKKAKDAVSGEELHIVVGSIPIQDEKVSNKIKLAVLEHLNKKYGLVEEDFVRSDLQFVPAGKARDVGFDQSLIASYGQDDRSSAYASLQALLNAKNPTKTTIAFYFDKEEIGSVGDSGARSTFIEIFTETLLQKNKEKNTALHALYKSKAINGDVTAASTPMFKDVEDPTNAVTIGRGVSIEKYGGGGGKYGTSEATSEYMQYLTNLFDKNKAAWQTGELGKVDEGGGGTIAMWLSKYGIDVADVGVPVLAMHAPYEITSKIDMYNMYKAYIAFYNAK
ncbi:aminopeptidase [Candidatus Woesearchaeota archaeon]|nr:aminopeptidase [Candidatus Woesearchaeota archaeon]